MHAYVPVKAEEVQEEGIVKGEGEEIDLVLKPYELFKLVLTFPNK